MRVIDFLRDYGEAVEEAKKKKSRNGEEGKGYTKAACEKEVIDWHGSW